VGRPESETPTDWELNLLHILWKIGSSKSDDIREYLRAKGVKRSDSALRTILRIMVRKGLVHAKQVERTFYYEAAVKKPAVEKRFFRHLIKSLFKGNREEFVLRVLEEADIDADVIEKMKKTIKGQKDRQRAE